MFPSTESSISLTYLIQLLCDVHWDEDSSYGLCAYLEIPRSVIKTIQEEHSMESERKMAFCKWYINNHPGSSWKHVAEALYRSQNHELLDQVPSLKGELIALLGGRGVGVCAFFVVGSRSCIHLAIVVYSPSLWH